ncbi:MAG: hypothetical protein J4F30_03850 [Acidobacteria bacterium]|nr:hypothetical protein [Acidobacteriota bacterium]
MEASVRAGPLLLAIGLLLLPGAPAAGSPSVTDYTLTSWTQYEGLPAARVWAITQDLDGYIWIGTDAGLVRFDGVDFEAWRDLRDEQLPRHEVTALYSALDGSLWVGFGIHGGIARIRDGNVVLYGEAEGIASGFVTFIIEDQRGTIWAGGLDGLHGFDGSRWTHLLPRSGLPEGPTVEAYRDGDRNLWVSHADGLYKQVGSDTFRADPAPAAFDSVLVGAVLDASGSTWRSTPYRFAFLRDSRGGVWVGTAGRGLWIGREASEAELPVVSSFTVQEGLSSEVVQVLFEDREGHVWVGTQSGLHQFSPRRVTPVSVPGGLVRAVEATPDGGIWAGTYDGVVQLSESGGPAFPQVEGTFGPVTALHGDKQGRLWVATLDSIRRYADGRFTAVTLPEKTPFSWVSALTTDPRGDLWICDMNRGIFRWSRGRLDLYEALPEENRGTVYTAYTDAAGNVWIGFTDGKLGVIRQDHTFRLYDSIPGVGGAVNVLYEDSAGALWVGAGDGLSRFDGERFTTATQRGNGLPVDSVSTVVEGGDGSLWVGTRSGILSVHPGEFDKLRSDPGHQVEFRRYDRFDGVLNMPVRLGHPVGARGADGRLWFATGGGAVVIDPGQLPDEQAPPPVRIEAVHVNGRRVADASSSLELPSGSSQLRIGYTALTYAAPARTQFRYRLEGFDPDWVEPETRREAIYGGLPAGEYRFQVIARNNRGVWNREGAVLELSVPPPFYQAAWFYAAGGIALVSLLLAAWKIREVQIHRRYSLILAERARLSREIHDTLLQSLVGVALQFDVLAGSLDGAPEQAKRRLQTIRKDVEEYIREARESIWSLRSRPSGRSLATVLRETCEHASRDTDLALDFTVAGAPLQVSTVAEEQLVRICREAVTNVLLHAEARRIEVALQYESDSILLRVSDDGHGFDAGRQTDDADGHLGLVSMKERAESVGGGVEIVSNREGGTEVRAYMPVP